MASFIFCPVRKTYIPRDEFYGDSEDVDAPIVYKEFQPFKSTVTGKMIESRKELRHHNKVNGVTDMRDYGQRHFETHAYKRKREHDGTTKAAKKERVKDLMRSMDQLKGN